MEDCGSMNLVYRISSLAAGACGCSPLTIGFLPLVDGHEIRLDPGERRVEAATLIDHSDEGFRLCGFSERAQELVRCHLYDALGIDPIFFCEDTASRVEGKDGVSDPGILYDLLTICFAWH
jgi:hypothetical protein